MRPGETLWGIAHRHGVDVEALAGANHLGPGQPLEIGRQLTIPAAVTPTSGQEPPSLAEIALGPPPESHRLALAWPVIPAASPVLSPFGPRSRQWHGGVDLRAGRGMAIRAAAPGVVVASGWEHAYGRVVKIWHGLDLMTVYAHNQENRVRVGDWVERGQIIALVGSTGRATTAHLHFEVRLDGRKYDPLSWLPAPGVVDVASSASPRQGGIR